jgi:RimJ/RimL family protein N-acetyltransferase
MSSNSTSSAICEWRRDLPTLSGRLVTLREPTPRDVGALVDLLSIADTSRFNLEEPVTEAAVRAFVDGILKERAGGLSFTYLVMLNTTRAIVGVLQVRQLEPSFETAECGGTLVPSVRGSGIFLETAQLVGSLLFGQVGAHRVEVRALLLNGRANGALRKLGAVQEGILRRSVRRGNQYLDQVLWSVLKDDWTEHAAPAGPRVH